MDDVLREFCCVGAVAFVCEYLVLWYVTFALLPCFGGLCLRGYTSFKC